MMTLEQVTQMMIVITTIEGRELDEYQVELWADILSDTDYEYAMKRVRSFYRSGITRRITVQDIVKSPDPNAWMNRGKGSVRHTG